MKIIKLRFKNLNSLYGEWEIDFSSPEYVNNGIFAIIGPTGAGKSTIMDAICLALYGRTPRLNKVNKNTNEIISRRTAVCFSELTFSTQAGIFRAVWSQHRAHNDPQRNLRDPQHELVDATKNKVIESKKSAIEQAIINCTGMDFNCFIRSMLLAQGSFAAFLQATPKERAPLLEAITGTEIYSRISIKTQERQAEERRKLKELEASLEGITLLTNEQIKDIQAEIEAKTRARKTYSDEIQRHQTAINWLEQKLQLEREISEIEKQIREVEQKIQDFAPLRIKLNLAMKANELEGEFVRIQEMRQNKKNTQSELNQKRQELKKVESTLQKSKPAIEKLLQKINEANQQINDLQPTLNRVRELDSQIQVFLNQKHLLESDLAKLQKRKNDYTAQIDNLQNELSEYQKQLKSAEDYLRINQNDSKLLNELTAIEYQLDSFALAKQKVARQSKIIDEDKNKLENMAIKAQKASKDLQQTSAIYQQAQHKCKTLTEQLERLLSGKLLREYRSEQKNLLEQLVLIRRINSLEEERKKLQDGVPCPLCGATEHPYAKGNIPKAGEIELRLRELAKIINNAEELENTIDAQHKEIEKLNTNKAEKERTLDQIKLQIETLNKQIEEKHQELRSAQNELAVVHQKLQQCLQPLGIVEVEDIDPTDIIAMLQQRLENWQANSATRDHCFTKIETLQAKLESLGQTQKENSDSIATKNSDLSSLMHQLDALRTQRRELFGDKLPDQEEQRLRNQLESCEAQYNAQQETYRELEGQQREISAIINKLSEDISSYEAQLQQSYTNFIVALAKYGFNDEKDFLAARIERSEQESLQKTAQDIDAQKTALQTRLQDRRESLNVLLENRITEQTIEFHQNNLTTANDQLGGTNETIGRLNQQLYENEQQTIRLAEKRNLIEAQRKEFERWDRLYQLIGSADGQKYQKFAQSLTFELLLKHANQQLIKLSDRYLLIPNRESPLEIDVIDNYQAGEIRSTKNLSGGESFIVSLALALGLSSMTSQKLAVDSLFLDEGFGTLDEDALDTALTALSSLQREGKMIGIISHVAVLKDRIPTQILIERGNFGRSTIKGPGVKRL